MNNNKKMYETIEKFFQTQDYKHLRDLENMLIANCKEEALKAASRSTSDTAIVKRMIKAGQKVNNSITTKAHRFDYNGRSFEGLTNGHYILATADSIGVELSEDRDRFAMEKFFNSLECDIELTIDLKDLKAFAKLADKSEPYIVKFEACGRTCYGGFNPQYLIDTLTYCNTDKIKVCTKHGYVMAPARIESESGDRLGLVCPISLKGYNSTSEDTENRYNR